MFTLIVAGDQETAQQLSNRRFRQRVDEDEAAGALEIGKPGAAAELFEILLAHKRLALHKRRDDLPPFLVGEADDGDLEHGRVQRQAAFDLYRRNVLTPG